MKPIKETPFHKVWKAEDGEMFGFQGEAFKYLVVDLRNGGTTALRTNSVLQAISWEPSFSPVEIMSSTLIALIEEFSHKNTNFNRIHLIDRCVEDWNHKAIGFGYHDLVIKEKFSTRQALANKFAEIYESL